MQEGVTQFCNAHQGELTWRQAQVCEPSLQDLERFFSSPPIKAIPLGGGLTNQCWYLLAQDSQEYVWRPVSAMGQMMGISRNDEARVLSFLQVTQLAPAPIWWSNHGLLVEWIVGNTLQSVSLASLNDAITAIHRLPVSRLLTPLPVFDFQQCVNRYWHAITDAQWKASLEPIALYFSQPPAVFPVQDCLCHLDLGAHNMIETTQNTKIIDWEYSALADPRIELALVSLTLTQSEAKRLIEQYCCHMGHRDIELWWQSVLAWQPYVRWMTLLWYVIANQHSEEGQHVAAIDDLFAQLTLDMV